MKENEVTLENKIREALPRLKQLTNGAIVYRPHWNMFSQKFEEGVYDELEYKDGYLYEYGEIIDTKPHHIGEDWKIEHPLKLNDVLEWLCLNKNYSCNMQDGSFYIFGMYWDLSSVFLADQSSELKEFLNSL